MISKIKVYQIIVLMLVALILPSCSLSSPQSTPASTIILEDEVPADGYLGTLDGKLLTSMNLSSGAITINGVGVTLDNGEEIEAQLQKGLIETIVKGIRVRVVPISHPEFEWSVKEIVAGGVPTPDISKTAEAYAQRCRMNGAILGPGSSDFGDSPNILGELLSEKMECEVSFIVAIDDILAPAFLSGDADFALTSFPVFLMNRNVVNITPLLLPSYENSSAYYRGAFIVRADSDAISLADFEGKIFAYTNQGHSFGYFMPRAMLASEGYDPNAFFSETIAVGYSTEDMITALTNGDADIGIVWATDKTDALIMAEEEMPDVLDNVKILTYTPWIPNRVIIVLDDLQEELLVDLKNALLEIQLDVGGKEALYGIYTIVALEEPDERFWNAVDLIDQAEQLDNEIGKWP